MPPRRTTSRRATVSSPESSPLSGDSDTEDTPGVTFGEPLTPKSAVKVTYGGKRKYKQTPPKLRVATGGDSSQARRRALSLVETSPNKPRSSGSTTRGRRRGSGRGAKGKGRQSSRVRSASPTSSIENDSMAMSNLEVALVDEEAGPSSSKGLRRSAGSGLEPRLAHPTSPKDKTAQGKGPRKRLLPQSPGDNSDGEVSSLTSLSSPEVQFAPTLPSGKSAPPRLARQFLRTQSHAVPGPGSKSLKSKVTLITQTKSLDDLFAPLDSTDEESCDEVETGNLVWVCIDTEGRLADCEAERDVLWWPAKVQLPKPLMRVLLFGNPPGDYGELEERKLDVNNPSNTSIRSLMLDGRIRFNEGNYRPSQTGSLQSSPRKKRKLDLETRWKEAQDLMNIAYDARESPLSSPTIHNTNSKTKGKGKSIAVDHPPVDDYAMELFAMSQRIWRAPSADPLLDLPGELVLAREGRTRTQYWPAKLLQYIKPKRENQRPKYKVLFFDGAVRQIERDWFWTTTDDEFASCNLGESTGNYGLDQDNDTLDNLDGAENFDRPFAAEDDAGLRSASPLPSLPAPDAEVFEYELSVTQQFEYTKPILAAVLEDVYQPTKSRNEGFMRGGGARKRVLDTIPLRGSLSARDKEEVAFLVRSWARRRERRREMGLSVDYPHDKLYPPQTALTALVPDPLEQPDDDAESVLTPTSDLSIGDTELAPSEADAPPSSFVPTDVGTDDEQESTARGSSEREPVVAAVEPADKVNGSHTTAVSPRVSENAQMGDDNPISTNEDTTTTDGVGPTPLRRSFHDLDAVEKITYCNNVLLQEAILQLLLWRTGRRTALGLLSPEEEQRLHDIAIEEGEKTDWVHDIIRTRQALDGTMLPSAKSKEKTNGNVAEAGTRGRTRRGA